MLYLSPLFFLLSQTYLYANSIDTMLPIWKILFPILFFAFLFIIIYFIQRRYNKRLKEQVQLNIEELRKKDEILLQQ